MIQVYRIPVPKERLRAMPKDERVLLLLLGYVANQISMFQKLVIFSFNKEPVHEIEQHASAVQSHLLVRLMVGAVNEGYEVVSTRFLQNRMATDYLPRLDAEGKQALDELKRLFGGSNLLNLVRKNFAFHHPRSDDIENAFDAACNDRSLDDSWSLYFSHHGFNSLFLMSDFVFVHGIGKFTDEPDPKIVHEKLVGQVSSASIHLIEFAKAFTAAAWIKHFGTVIDAKDIVTISDAPNMDQVWLPFFVEVGQTEPNTKGEP